MGAGTWHRRGAAPLGVAFAALAIAAPAPHASAAPFSQSDLPIPQRVYDLGTAYVNGDTDPDLFTSAHNNRQVVLIGDGTGGFDDQISALDLDHTPAFPGLEAINNAPALGPPGLYLFYRPQGLRLVAHGVSAAGNLRSRAFRRATARDGANARTGVIGEDLSNIRVHYEIPPGGRVDVKMVPLALPVRARLKTPAPGSTFVGSQAVAASAERFSFELRDRHGMGWADVDADGDTDVLSVRGGLANRIKGDRNLVQDQLLLRSGGVYQDFTAEQGIRKGRCRSRNAMPVEVNGDARTDLSLSCKEGVARLFVRSGDGFANASGQLKRARVRGAEVEWADVTGTVLPELITFHRERANVYGREGDGSWRVLQRVDGLAGEQALSIASADFDNDGDADVLVSATDGVSLLRNAGGVLRVRRPGSIGLPGTAEGPVAWIDHQNDGLLDLYAPPGGIYEQQPGGDFVATGQLATGKLTTPRAVWMDFDGDGDRDGALTAREKGGRFSKLYENQLAGDHWLEVDVEGRDGSREAPGARVRVEAGGEVQTSWVGQSDSSRFSAGDWRLYFGLGDETTADVSVRWTDGTTSQIPGVEDNQLLRVERP